MLKLSFLYMKGSHLDLNAIGLVIIAMTPHSSLTFFPWWSALGKSLNFQDGAPMALAIPVGSIEAVVSIKIFPIFLGMYNVHRNLGPFGKSVDGADQN